MVNQFTPSRVPTGIPTDPYKVWLRANKERQAFIADLLDHPVGYAIINTWYTHAKTGALSASQFVDFPNGSQNFSADCIEILRLLESYKTVEQRHPDIAKNTKNELLRYLTGVNPANPADTRPALAPMDVRLITLGDFLADKRTRTPLSSLPALNRIDDSMIDFWQKAGRPSVCKVTAHEINVIVQSATNDIWTSGAKKPLAVKAETFKRDGTPHKDTKPEPAATAPAAVDHTGYQGLVFKISEPKTPGKWGRKSGLNFRLLSSFPIFQQEGMKPLLDKLNADEPKTEYWLQKNVTPAGIPPTHYKIETLKYLNGKARKKTGQLVTIAVRTATLAGMDPELAHASIPAVNLKARPAITMVKKVGIPKVGKPEALPDKNLPLEKIPFFADHASLWLTGLQVNDIATTDQVVALYRRDSASEKEAIERAGKIFQGKVFDKHGIPTADAMRLVEAADMEWRDALQQPLLDRVQRLLGTKNNGAEASGTRFLEHFPIK